MSGDERTHVPTAEISDWWQDILLQANPNIPPSLSLRGLGAKALEEAVELALRVGVSSRSVLSLVTDKLAQEATKYDCLPSQLAVLA